MRTPVITKGIADRSTVAFPVVGRGLDRHQSRISIGIVRIVGDRGDNFIGRTRHDGGQVSLVDHFRWVDEHGPPGGLGKRHHFVRCVCL